jgi:hypothetical protein
MQERRPPKLINVIKYINLGSVFRSDLSQWDAITQKTMERVLNLLRTSSQVFRSEEQTRQESSSDDENLASCPECRLRFEEASPVGRLPLQVSGSRIAAIEDEIIHTYARLEAAPPQYSELMTEN